MQVLYNISMPPEERDRLKKLLKIARDQTGRPYRELLILAMEKFCKEKIIKKTKHKSLDREYRNLNNAVEALFQKMERLTKDND